MNIVEISQHRYTTKHYDNTKQVSTEHLEQLLSVLRNSPSSVNSQPWHFVIIDNQKSGTKILPAVAEFNHARIVDSSYTIVFCVKEQLDEAHLKNLLEQEDKDGRYPSIELKQAQDNGRHYFVGLNSTTPEKQHEWKCKQLYIALGNLMFAAAAINIDSTAIEGYDAQKMDEILDLKQQGLKSVVLASIGYRSPNDGNATRTKSRLPKEQLFSFI